MGNNNEYIYIVTADENDHDYNKNYILGAFYEENTAEATKIIYETTHGELYKKNKQNEGCCREFSAKVEKIKIGEFHNEIEKFNNNTNLFHKHLNCELEEEKESLVRLKNNGWSGDPITEKVRKKINTLEKYLNY